MGGKMHTAESYARGVRSLRERVSDKWMAKGSEWTSLPLLLARCVVDAQCCFSSLRGSAPKSFGLLGQVV